MSLLYLGTVRVAPDGTLLPPPGGAATIGFAWRGRPCRAALTPGRLQLSALAGRIPSTAEPGADRARAFAALRALRRAWRPSLAPDHTVRVQREVALPDPPTAVSLVTAMVGFVLALDPYLEGLGAPGSGTAKTWPG
ncbi:MAG TPA: hypothetical protein VD970_13935 [Acetobacteraceae bacterium]|nr:hypothetical protein [Acetobacteraceae bacterium]